MIQIDQEFKALIPPLSAEERAQLEANIIAEGCRDAIVTWRGVIVDGHNRHEICTRNGIDYRTVEREFETRDDVKLWIVQNQFGRRNLPTYERARLALAIKPIIAAKAKANKQHGGRPKNGSQNSVNHLNIAPIDTQKELAALSGVSHDTIAKIERIERDAPAEVKQALSRGDISINKAYLAVTRDEKKAEVKARLEEVAAREAELPTGIYDVIVIDPPWPMEKIERDVAPNQTGFDYPTMSEQELAALSIPAADDCHMWLWTTHKFLPMALRLLDAWGFKYVCTFVWHKPGGFQPFGLPQFNCEFAIYARKGTPIFLDQKAFNTCFNAPRGAHSEKPEEFYDVVRRVTGGRRLDMFNRRHIEGFAGWGKEAA